MNELKIDPELMALLGPASEFSDVELERQLVEDGGPREPIVVWNGFILDGHRRYKFCRRYHLLYDRVELDLPDKEAAKQWVIRNQLARRNITPGAEAKFVARLAEDMGIEATAEATGKSVRSVFRAKSKAASLAALDDSIREKVEGMPVSVGPLRALAGLPPEHQIKVVGQVESGEFSSLAAAVRGEQTDRVSSSPAKPVDYFGGVITAVGLLKRAIDRLNQEHPNPLHKRAIRAAGQVETIVAEWKKGA